MNEQVRAYDRQGTKGLWVVRFVEGRVVGWTVGGSERWNDRPSDLRSIARHIATGEITPVGTNKRAKVQAMVDYWMPGVVLAEGLDKSGKSV